MSIISRNSLPGIMAAVAFLAYLCIVPKAVWCHAYLDHADPKVGSTISESPHQVRIWFDSDLEPLFSTIVVQDADGKTVDKGDSRVDPADPTLLEVSIPPLPYGTYRVLWNVVARDTHRTMGNFTFTIK